MTVETASASGRVRAEIESIDRELQEAFDRIIDAVERVMTATEAMAPDVTAGINAAVTDILEASSVRDIVGQRLTAVRVAVDRLEAGGARTEGGSERKRDKSAKVEEKQDRGSASESGLLNGPQLPGAARTQTEVDALFDKLD